MGSHPPNGHFEMQQATGPAQRDIERSDVSGTTANAEAGPSTPRTPAQVKPYPQPSHSSKHASTNMDPRTLSSYLIKHPDHSVGKAISKQFPAPNPIKRLVLRFKVKHSVIKGMKEKEMHKLDETEGAVLRQRAGWKLRGEEGPGAEVSELFWKVCRQAST